jgi:glycogen phosphorylase
MIENLNLPESLKPLGDLAYNLWFSWNPDARDLFREMDVNLWREHGRNPVAFIKNIDPKTLKKFSEDEKFIEKVNYVYQRFKNYINTKNTLFKNNFPNLDNQIVAYFSAEYGLHESLPNYAGGLGILSGDHCKTASDIGLPFVAIGLMYKHAYFNQYINEAGEQIEEYRELNLGELPIQLVRDENDQPVLVSVPVLNREVFIKIWRVAVGRIQLYLLDTNVSNNSDEDKNIIHSLYGGTRDIRIQQEIILGIGGLRALRKMDINPVVFHMNEGHSAFLGLERLYELINEGMNFKPALELIRSTTLFTTHTPIPAGNEAFEFDMMERYFKDFWPELEMSDNYFFNLGRNLNEHQHENFSLTVLALNLSYMSNGVSKLHSEVSKMMWQRVYPGIPASEVPIDYVTNGIHTESWLNREMIKLFDEYLGKDWRENILDEDYWNKVFDIPDDVYWNAMVNMKKNMINHITRVYKNQLERYQGDHGFPPVDSLFKDDVLTIGFARRFAPYKRATLLFSDKERIKKIFKSDKPVQILFSGKAHPQNDAGKDLIKEINNIAREEGFRGSVIFVENYGINVSRPLTSGVDVWLNNPRRPLEASGTSGQKVPINGGINFSVLDGWWPEGYNGKNGWVIGQEIDYIDHSFQDKEDSKMLYDTLENEIIPLYYKRDKNGIPKEWIKTSKESLRSTLTKFSTHTMLWNYTNKFYVPGMRRNISYTEKEYASLNRFTQWMNRVKRHWHSVNLTLNGGNLGEDIRIFSAGENKEISINVFTGPLKTNEIRVELILERQDAIKGHQDMEIYPMGLIGQTDDKKYEYRARVKAKQDGSYRFNCRIIPMHQDLYNLHDTRLIKWLD